MQNTPFLRRNEATRSARRLLPFGPPGSEVFVLKDAIRSLKLDRRLATRRGWIQEQELSHALGQLPDVKDKAAEPAPAQPPGEDAQNA